MKKTKPKFEVMTHTQGIMMHRHRYTKSGEFLIDVEHINTKTHTSTLEREGVIWHKGPLQGLSQLFFPEAHKCGRLNLSQIRIPQPWEAEAMSLPNLMIAQVFVRYVSCLELNSTLVKKCEAFERKAIEILETRMLLPPGR